MDLRPYQVSAITEARKQVRAGKKRVLIVLPTGGGKTVVASEIIRSATSLGSRVLFLAHRRELIKQTCDKLLKFGVEPGVIMSGFPKALQRPVQVASVQTLIRRQGDLQRVDLIFLDEAHHATTENTYAQLMEWYPGAAVVGLTATPWRQDGKGLADVFDGHVIGSTPRQLRDEGFLVPVGGWQYETVDTTEASVRGGDFVAKELEASATSKRVVGDVIGEWQQHAGGGRTVLFAVSVEHSQMMAAEFVRAGVPAEHLDGNTPAEVRDGILARLKAGQTRVVTNCNVLTEGWDCPEAEVCILARPTLSTSLYLQMVGRVLRTAPGKTQARIHDHSGCLSIHGHPYAERDYDPAKAVKGDRKNAEGGGTARNPRCPSCKSIYSRWPCDNCGYSPSAAQLRYEFEEAAAKREITNDGTAPAAARTADEEKRRRRWLDVFGTDAQKKLQFFISCVDRKDGNIPAARGYYRWYSGELEWPPRVWKELAERHLAVRAVRAG